MLGQTLGVSFPVQSKEETIQTYAGIEWFVSLNPKLHSPLNALIT
jgi:hypothetical protein